MRVVSSNIWFAKSNHKIVCGLFHSPKKKKKNKKTRIMLRIYKWSYTQDESKNEMIFDVESKNVKRKRNYVWQKLNDWKSKFDKCHLLFWAGREYKDTQRRAYTTYTDTNLESEIGIGPEL